MGYNLIAKAENSSYALQRIMLTIFYVIGLILAQMLVEVAGRYHY